MTNNLPLADSARNYFRISGIISFAILFVLSVVGGSIIFISMLSMPSIWFVLGWLVFMGCLAYFMIVFYPNKKFDCTQWRFDDQGLFIYRGIWWRKQYAVPRSRVQHIDVTQGPVQRSYDIAELILHTAGTMNASVSLTGLSHEDAVSIRDELLVQEKFDAV